jgi:glycosyltransferase involved in cell wall biosynthesis
MKNDPDRPTISVITAAYNRSNVLKFAVASVIWQTFGDWELIIVDDASTDDTPDVVASFDDPRVHYVRLEENTGEQSGPNNIGLRHARGSCIAYLNQDDLWFPDHLEKLMQCMEITGAPWVCAPAFAIDEHGGLRLCGTMPDDRFTPEYGRVIFATLWLIKRRTLEKIGPWRFYRTLRIPPSQDLMLRAWKMGIPIRTASCVTAIVIHSASRTGSYRKRLFEENLHYYDAIRTNPRIRDEMTTRFCLWNEQKHIQESLRIVPAFNRLAATLVKRVGLIFGIMPADLSLALRFKKKGALVDSFRKKRGLPKLKHKPARPGDPSGT